MMKKRENLDMATILEETIFNYLEDRKLTGSIQIENIGPAQLEQMRQAFLPVIWSALPSILTQLNAKALTAEEAPDEILAGFTVPDTLEGLIL
ncbi:hypothetical protein IV500_05840 [Paeniglutamicibacter antarcticus]|uniref:Uncharacterized protein n=1 Tax=Arthrobacter terrae TaxID=2935737 RepID=A0A931G762_9MICC|nr:hypothetical protein [Arthrobacter terrae]MBG0738944.1 hypothetical protein [Arthrobacter terrae]